MQRPWGRKAGAWRLSSSWEARVAQWGEQPGRAEVRGEEAGAVGGPSAHKHVQGMARGAATGVHRLARGPFLEGLPEKDEEAVPDPSCLMDGHSTPTSAAAGRVVSRWRVSESRGQTALARPVLSGGLHLTPRVVLPQKEVCCLPRGSGRGPPARCL